MLTLSDERSELWQWDTNRKLTVDADCSQVHFSNKVFGRSIDVDVADGIAIIPDILLQTDKDLAAWAFVGTAENGYTKISKVFKVNKRNKPADYVFTPTDQTTLEELVERLEKIEKTQDPDAIKNAVDDYLSSNPIQIDEKDPTVPDWAKQTSKPKYTAKEVGAVATVNGISPDESGNVQVKVPDSVEGAVLYTEQELTEEQKAQARANIGLSVVEPMEDDIPKVFFGVALPQTKTDTIMSFRYISKTEDISGYCKTKAQGNTSMSYPKKNQTVKLYKDAECTEKLKVDFKGWGKQNKFCFKANWVDLTHARNIVSARLWGDVVKSRSNYAEIPELLRTSPNQGAVDGFPVKVYANGVYQGRYTINIPKDAWMANMDDELDTHCILCGENYVSGCFRAEAKIDGSDWTDEVHDTVPDSIKTRWNEAIRFVMNSTDEEFTAGIGNYFDIPSLIDYYLFGLVSCGLDAFGKNQLYMTYDGQKWYATMYDLDSTWGLWWNGSTFVSTSYARSEYQDFKDGNGNLLYIRLESLFMDEIKERWNVLKSGALSVENIINRFERFTDIAPPYLVEEDYASTTGDGTFTGIPAQTTNNIQQIRAYAIERLVWTEHFLNPEVKALYPFKNGTFTYDDVTLTVSNGNHVKLTRTASANRLELCLSDYTINKVLSGWENVYAQYNWFKLTAGDEVVLKRCNTIVNSLADTEVKSYVRIFKPWSNESIATYDKGLLREDETHTFTVESDGYVGCIIIDIEWSVGALDVEFDIEMYVNGERYV